MKWKNEPYPRCGDERIITRFAYLPERLDNEYTVWLESYKCKQVYQVWYDDSGWSTYEKFK